MSMASLAPSREVLDADDLLTRCMGNAGFAMRVLAKFRHRFEQDLVELEQAFHAQDAEAIAHTAHRIKGASASVSATRLRKRAGEIEHYGRSGQLEEAAVGLSHLRREWDHFLQELTAQELEPDAIR